MRNKEKKFMNLQVQEVSMPHMQYSIICYSILNPCEVASNFTRYTGVEYGLRNESGHSMEAMYALTRSAGLSEVVRGRILAGNYFLLRENKERYLNQALKVGYTIYFNILLLNYFYSKQSNFLYIPR